MKDIISKIEDEAYSKNTLIEILVVHDNERIDEINGACDQVKLRDLEILNLQEALQLSHIVHADQAKIIAGLNATVTDLRKEVADQLHVIEREAEALRSQDKDKQIYLDSIADLKRQSTAFQLANQQLEHKVDVLKDTAKTTKEQIKRNKAAALIKDAKIKRLEKGKKQLPGGKKRTDFQELTTVYSKPDNVLVIYPNRLVIGIEGKKTEQVVLLYTNRRGSFVTCFLKDNNELSFSTFMDDEDALSPEDLKTIKDNCMEVPAEVAKYAQEWLYRVNVMQKLEIRTIDTVCLA